MPSPLELLNRYRNLKVPFIHNNGRQCHEAKANVCLRKYFMMDWDDESEERTDFNHVVRGGRRNDFYQQHKDKIKSAAMGKGSPDDYQLALEWAVRSGKVRNPSAATIQGFCDERLGIDCSGFATNYLIANGRRSDTPHIKRNSNAASYFSKSRAINDPWQIRSGDLLVWMTGNRVKRGPGHIAVIESHRAQSMGGSGNMRVVESTGASAANPKLLDSMYVIEDIIDKGGRVPCMMLIVKRHGRSGSRVSVMRY